MKKQITVIVRKEERQIITMEFPIYRKDEQCDDYGYICNSIHRIDADGSEVILRKIELSVHGGLKYEIEFAHFNFSANDADFILGKIYYNVASADEFNTMLHEMKEAIGKFISGKTA